MFYDNFSEDQICGLFTPWHFFAIAMFFLWLTFALVFSRKMTPKQIKITLLVIAIVVTVMEIIKIALRIYKNDSLDSWMPLYFCSIFLFAIWLSLFKNKHIKLLGQVMVVFGGILPAISFIFYPSTSLMIFPIWHPGSIHSLLYHWLMLYAGCLTLKIYQPKAVHFLYYFGFVTVFTIAAAIVNHFCGTNMMFLSNPFGLDILQSIYNVSKHLYAFLAYIAQAVVVFWIEFGIFKLIFYLKKKIKQKHNRNTIKGNESNELI